MGIVFLCWLTKRIYRSSLMPLGRILRYIYVYFGSFMLHIITLIWLFKISGIISFNLKILPDAMSSYASLSLLNTTIISITCIFIYFSKLRRGWKWIIFVALYASLYTEYKINLISIKEGWFLTYTTIAIFGTYLYVFMLDKLYGSRGKSPNSL